MVRSRGHGIELAEVRTVCHSGLGGQGQVMRTRRTVRVRLEVLR